MVEEKGDVVVEGWDGGRNKILRGNEEAVPSPLTI